ncbi:hypothetical protein QBC39DRAFT_126741 [Podospora conica]|nr:hypothetical protein QBC39DRAFT_126741 [Schizothecium conicum]
MIKQYSFHPAPNCHPDRQYAPYNPAAFNPSYTSYNPNNSNSKRHSVQNYTGIYNGIASNDRNGGNRPARPTSHMPPASNGQYYQAYRVNMRRPSMTTIPPAPTRPPPPPPRQSNPEQSNGPTRPKHLRRLSPLVIPASASPPPIFLMPEPPRMPPPQHQYRAYQAQPPTTTLPHQPQPVSRPPPLMRPEPQRPPPPPPPGPASAEIESFLYQNPCMLPPMPMPTTRPSPPPRYSLPPLPTNAAPQLRRSKASRRTGHHSAITPRRVSAGPWSPPAHPTATADVAPLSRKFSFEATRTGVATEERRALLEDVTPARGSSDSEEGGSVQEAVTPVDGETPAEYRRQQADALRGLLGLVVDDEGEVEGVMAGFGHEVGGDLKGGVGGEEEREMVVRGLGRFSAEEYLAEVEGVKGIFV